MAVFAGLLSSCKTPPDTHKVVEGYPVYKFLNFGGVKGRNLLRVQMSGGEEIGVYVRDKDYRELWKTNPHDLHAQGKSHFVRIGYEEIESESVRYNWATSFQAELVDRDPILRK